MRNVIIEYLGCGIASHSQDLPATHNKKSDDQKGQAPISIVSTDPVSIERLADTSVKVNEPKVAVYEFQTPIGGEILLNEFNGQILLDDASQRRYSQAHYRGLLCAESGSSVLSLKTAQEAFLLPVDVLM